MATLEMDITTKPEADTYVQVSAVWMLTVGYFLFDQVVLNPWPLTTRAEDFYQPGELYRGGRLGLDRWDFWHKRMTEMFKVSALSEESRQLVRKAAFVMGSIARDIEW
ncbi:hypothetical protein BDW62DRAFT_200817 [Aspergillus aurantiobrunneus]